MFPSQDIAERAVGLLALSESVVDYIRQLGGAAQKRLANWENKFASKHIRPHLAELCSKNNVDITFSPFMDREG